jgi:energy-coupling factor transporter ATP-binding protein EcfA2
MALITKLSITGFRAFKRLEVDGLSRINVIVGKNNAGKSCLLDAVHAVVSRHPQSLIDAGERRQEYVYTPDQGGDLRASVDVRCNFFGWTAVLEPSFSITAFAEETIQKTHAELVNPFAEWSAPRAGQVSSPHSDSTYALRWKTERDRRSLTVDLPLGHDSGLSKAPPGNYSVDVGYVSTNLATPTTLAQAWNMVAGQPSEDFVLTAMRFIEPRIERITALSNSPAFFLRLSGVAQRVPLGSLGEGVRRLFFLACKFAAASNGVLLVDEIESGLHYSAMQDVWRLVLTWAELFDVQLFATTHSHDCLRALGAAIEQNSSADLSLHRLNAAADGAIRVTRYSKEEVVLAANEDIEVR